MPPRSIVRITVSLLIAAALVGVAVHVVKRKKAEEAAIPPAKTYALVVPTRKAQETEVRLTLPYLALIHSDTETTIASKITARVLMIKPVGTRVRKGELIVQLDASSLEAERKGLEARIRQTLNEIRAKRSELEALEKTHRRNAQLLAIQAIPKDRFETEAARIDSLKSSIAALQSSITSLQEKINAIRDTLSYVNVLAPADGVVSKTWVTAGGTARASKPLIELSGGTERRLLVRVPHETHPTRLLWKDTSCDLTPLGSTYHGLDEYSCHVATDIPPGNRVEVRLVVFTGKAILLPPEGLLAIDGRREVLELKENQAVPHSVELLAEGLEGYAVRGVTPGTEYLVAKPDILLQAKAGVRIVRAGRH